MAKHNNPCPDCGSSTGLSIYDNGTYCHSCRKGDKSKAMNEDETATPLKYPSAGVRPLPSQYRPFTERGLSRDTVEKFRVTVFSNPDVDELALYPYFDADLNHVANKVRRRFKKGFRWEGDPSRALLFGQHLFPAGSAKAITLVEGQDDALAAYEMMGSKYPVVSVDSASSAPRDVARQFEYLNSFPQIVICFDKDEAKVGPDGSIRYPGQEAALAVANMFEIGKVRILTLQEGKDPNDYCMPGSSIKDGREKFVREWWRAPTYTPAGLKLGKDMWDEIINRPQHRSVPYPWAGLNKMTYGMRLGELVVITADTGVGKTSVLKEIEHPLLLNPELIKEEIGVGFMHFEEPNHDTALGLMSVHNSKPYHLPDTERTTDELRNAYDAVLNNGRAVIWDHFGSNDIHEVLAKVRHMHNLGCKYIIIDHLSIIVSDQSGDERKQLDEITTKLKTLTMELNISVLCVIHTNRNGQIRGTAGVEQLANMVIKLYREKTDPDPWRRNVTKLIIEKNRFCGLTGPACYLYYNPETGRLYELEEELVRKYEDGEKVNDDELPWA